MALKQISLTVPEPLLKASKSYCIEFGYRNVQELVIELMRDRIFLENIDHYRKISERMDRGKGVKTFDQKGALKYLRDLGK